MPNWTPGSAPESAMPPLYLIFLPQINIVSFLFRSSHYRIQTERSSSPENIVLYGNDLTLVTFGENRSF